MSREQLLHKLRILTIVVLYQVIPAEDGISEPSHYYSNPEDKQQVIPNLGSYFCG